MSAIELGEVNRDNNADGDEAAADANEAERNLDDDRRNLDDDRRNRDDDRRNESIFVFDGSNPNAGAGSSRTDTSTIPKIKKHVAAFKRGRTQDKKNFFKENFRTTLSKTEEPLILNKTAGPSSTILFDKMELTFDENQKNDGIMYKGVKVVFLENEKMEYSTGKNRRYVSATNEFKELIKKAEKEYQTTLEKKVREKLKKDGVVAVDETVDDETVDEIVENVRENSIEWIDEMIYERIELFTGIDNMVISENALREIRGPLFANEANIGVLEHLDKNAEHWKELSETEKTEGREGEAKLYEAIAEASKLKADQIRLRLNQQPEGEQAQSIVEEEIENNVLGKFERFKKWAKENLGTISAITISVAGIITTIIVGAKSALKAGAKATSNFANGLANLAKKLAPVLGALLNIVAQILTLGAKGIGFLSKNLSILAIAIAYFLYDKFKNRKREK